jgi:hypothetical protein
MDRSRPAISCHISPVSDSFAPSSVGKKKKFSFSLKWRREEEEEQRVIHFDEGKIRLM